MKHHTMLTTTALACAALTLSACAATEEAPAAEEGAAIVKPLSAKSKLSAVTLVGQAAQRLGVETTPVREASRGSAAQTVLPYSAIIYDPSGGTWTYKQTKPGTYVRETIVVDRIVGSRAFLIDGPPAGTAVVSVGAAELYGAEVGVDH